MSTGNVIDPTRFEKINADECRLIDGQLKYWASGWLDDRRPNQLGEFLSKIWAHYGPPNQVHYEGFTYCFLDREIGSIFSAYSAGNGPAFGGHFRKYDDTNGFIILEEEVRNLNDSVKAFEKLLENTTPDNCEIHFDTDFGVYRIGAKDGVPFEEAVDKN